jgi:hypothetical protein
LCVRNLKVAERERYKYSGENSCEKRGVAIFAVMELLGVTRAMATYWRLVRNRMDETASRSRPDKTVVVTILQLRRETSETLGGAFERVMRLMTARWAQARSQLVENKLKAARRKG